MKGKIGETIAALKLATDSGGNMEAHLYATALRGLVQLRKAVLEHDRKLNDEERIPTGDDYNALMSLLGLDGNGRADSDNAAAHPSRIEAGQVLSFADPEHRARYEERLTKVISTAMEKDESMREEAVLEGRFGLREMDDSTLLTLGTESWNLFP